MNRAQRTDLVDAAADELYSLPLAKFTAARAGRARQAREHGDRPAAAAIGKLAKPSLVAWLANQLAREHADAIGSLLEVGTAMRQATASLDAGRLRQLSRQRHELVRALVQQARVLANAAGHAVSGDTARGLEDTLHAALADEEVARLLARGRLTSALTQSGFPGIAADRGHPTGTATTSTASEADARRDLQEAQRVREQASDAVVRAEQSAREAAADVSRLEAELDAAVSRQVRADHARRQARKDADLAGRAERRAGQRLREAAARRETSQRRD